MKVKQCDRCKAIENPREINGGVGRVEFPRTGLKILHWSDGNIDLCSKCLIDFMEYIKPKSDNK